MISRVFEKSLGGKKTHISAVTRVGSFTNEAGYSLPPLMDTSPQAPNAIPAVDSVHVPCFSNVIGSAPAQRNREVTDPAYASINPVFSASCSIPRAPILGSLYSAQPIPGPPRMPFPCPTLMQQHSVPRALLQNPNPKAERDILAAWQGTGLTSIPNNPEITFHDQRQQAPSTSAAGAADLAFMWNY